MQVGELGWQETRRRDQAFVHQLGQQAKGLSTSVILPQKSNGTRRTMPRLTASRMKLQTSTKPLL